MDSATFLSLGLCFLFLFHGVFAQIEHRQEWQGLQQQGHPQRARSGDDQCRIQRLNAQEPNRRYESEAGTTEFWDRNDGEFGCAGLKAVRHVIQARGLLLPAYNSRGIQGTVLPGCAETYETRSQSSTGDREQRSTDRHQKVRRIQEGDILALPAGLSHWAYNDGELPLICVAIIDTGNEANQLDENYRKFFLAGSSEQEGGRGGQEGQSQRGEQQEFKSVFNGFDQELLADIFNVDSETARKLQGQDDQRGRIVRADRFQVTIPEFDRQEEEERQHGRGSPNPNGLEEITCTLKLRYNLGSPRRADVYNPRGGRTSSVNSDKLPVLSLLRLSAKRGVLYKNAILAPHWNINAHSAMYVTRGSGRVQVVGDSGRSVFDGEVREGQLLVIPQNYAVLKKAGNEGLEFVSFKTNDNAMSIPLAGRLSALRAMPEEVLANSYDISREEARNLKYNRDELRVFGPLGSGSPKG
ncbi:unnamed protein product [Ilex paraguariensis]|uniref:Cupin type-1 domain-containing protein n=1 Tax=Ilex paraguariensis TaxID=185542 RepID=A0ABC8V4I9_9AQUA